jgi:O-antigen ligase
MVTRQRYWKSGSTSFIDPIDLSKAGQSPLLKCLVMIWLLGMVVLLPLDLLKLPYNATVVDIWVGMGLPIFWLSFACGKQSISLSYTIPMWFILVGSFASTYTAPAQKNSFIVILKEVYAFIWFVTLTAVLVKTNARDLRRLLVAWIGVAFLHGGVIVAQFLSPDFWRFIASLAGSTKDFELYRPNGLFMNPNWAAVFQLLGFIPIVLVSPSPKVALILGLLLLPTMLLTGSMGAVVAFIAGLTVAILVMSLSGHLVRMIKTFVSLAIMASLLGGLFYVIASHNERYQEHFEHIFLGRAEKSSESRFDLWRRGKNAFIDNNVFLWGIGPENFRVVDGRDHQLHNDILAFAVERGLLGAFGVVLFAIIALSKAVYIARIQHQYPTRARPVVIVFLGAMTAIIVESLTHQTFHFRTLWIFLALQEATLHKMTASKRGWRPLFAP